MRIRDLGILVPERSPECCASRDSVYLCRCADQKDGVDRGSGMESYWLVAEKQEFGLDIWILGHRLLFQMCMGMGMSLLDIDYPADCQAQLSIREILVGLAVNHKYMLAEVLRILVAERADNQAGAAAAAAAAQSWEIPFEIVLGLAVAAV